MAKHNNIQFYPIFSYVNLYDGVFQYIFFGIDSSMIMVKKWSRNDKTDKRIKKPNSQSCIIISNNLKKNAIHLLCCGADIKLTKTTKKVVDVVLIVFHM